MIILLMLPFLFSGFEQKWYIPYGTIAPGGRILVYDSDHDEKIELIFRRWIAQSFGVYFVEFVPPDSWDIYESIYVDSILVWDAGDFDNNGYADLITDGDASSGGPPVPIISVYESPDSFSYPTQEVWRDTVDIGTVQPICAYDIDRDGINEIVQTGGEAGTSYYIDFSIYEGTDDNMYEVKYFFESPETPTSTVAFGDFDNDSLNEFVMGTIDGQYSIFESPANDTYIPLHVNVQLSTVNIKDCFSVSDADGDGKMEFVVKGFVIPSAEIHAFIFEATGDNTYEIIKTFTLPGGDYYGGYSEAGDVDGDSIPEIVLEARQNVFIIKSAGNDSFYVWETLPGHASGSCVRVYDIDGNGLAEIIISGNNETRIYEYDPGGIEQTALRLLPNALRLEVCPNPFSKLTYIKFQAPSFKNQVTLSIYDVSGRIIKSFDPEGLRTEGQFDYQILKQFDQITWDGKDIFGHQVPVGVYFVRLETSNYRETKKVILLK